MINRYFNIVISIPGFVKMARDRFDEYIRLRREVSEFIDETDQVLQEIDAFHCGDIVQIMYSCSEQLDSVYTSPGNREMSHDEKRLMAKRMVNKCVEDIIEVSQLGLTYTADSTTVLMLRERVNKLDKSRLSGSGLERTLKHYSMDIKNLADYVSNSRDLNINGDSDLGDTPSYDSEQSVLNSPCVNCKGNCKKE